MRLTVIGCSGSFPGPDSPASCYLVEAPDDGRMWRLLLDIGNGAFGVLQRFVDPYQVDAVALSHMHADHCLDLCSFYVARKYHPDGPRPRIPVFGPQEAPDRMAQAYGLAVEPGMSGEFDFLAWKVGETTGIGPFAVTVAPVNHPVEAYAIRVEAGGRVLVYSGDTGPCEGLVHLARGADLLLCEASFRTDDAVLPDVHLTGRQAGEHAARAGVGRLVLTHVPPWHNPAQLYDEARPVYDGHLDLARIGAVYDV